MTYTKQFPLNIVADGDNIYEGITKLDNENQAIIDILNTVSPTTATGIINSPAGTISATNVQAAINELDTEKETPAGAQAKVNVVQTNLTNHINDTLSAHSANSITNYPYGNIVSVDLQGAINELDNKKVAKGELIVNAKDFWVVADGVMASVFSIPTGTDNTTFLQNAINYAITNKKKLYIPNGFYVVTDTLIVNGAIEIITDIGTTIIGNIMDKTKPVIKISNSYRGSISNLRVYGCGYIPLAAFEFTTPNNIRFCLNNVQGIRCRRGLYCTTDAAIDRLSVINCQFVDNMLSGIRLNSTSAPILLLNTECESNGYTDTIKATTYQGIAVWTSSDTEAYQIYASKFINLSIIGGQYSNSEGRYNVELAKFKDGYGLSVVGSDIEGHHTIIKKDGTVITKSSSAAVDENTSVLCENVLGVNISQIHFYDIKSNSVVKILYECGNVSIKALDFNTIDTVYTVDANCLQTIIDYDGNISLFSVNALRSLNKQNKFTKLFSYDLKQIVPTYTNPKMFDNAITLNSGANYGVVYTDPANPTFTNCCYSERNVWGATMLFVTIKTTVEAYISGKFFIECLDSAGARLGYKTFPCFGYIFDTIHFFYDSYTLPTGTYKIRWGVFNEVNEATASLGSAKCSIQGLSVHAYYANPILQNLI